MRHKNSRVADKNRPDSQADTVICCLLSYCRSSLQVFLFLENPSHPDFRHECEWLTHSMSDLSLPQGKAGSGWDVFPVGMWDHFLGCSKGWHSPESESHRKEQGFLTWLHITAASIKLLLYPHLYTRYKQPVLDFRAFGLVFYKAIPSSHLCSFFLLR